MILLDKETYQITCPTGDTGQFTLSLTDIEGNPLDHEIEGVAVFAVCQQINNVYVNIRQKAVELVNNMATIVITPGFSRGIPSGEYFWDIRIVTDPGKDEEGNIITDERTDEVHSLFAARKGGLPRYRALAVAVDIGIGGEEIV